MKRTLLLATMGLALVASSCSDTVGPDGNQGTTPGDGIEGSWTGAIPAGSSVEIKGIGGAIRAVASRGNEVEVSWTKRGRHDDPSAVRVDVVEHADGVTLCAVYPDTPGWAPNACVPGFGGEMHVENNDVEVTFTVRLPAGVDFIARNIAGDIEAAGVDGSVFAYSTAADIDITTSRLATATTISGSITAEIGLPNWDRDLEFKSMTGNVRVVVPANTNAEVWATSMRGRITSDFRLTEIWKGQMRGTLGLGGRRLTLSALDGNITLRRGAAR